MSKKSTIQIAIVAAIVCCLIAINASAAATLSPANSSSINIASIIAVVLAIAIIAFKTASKNLKKVGKHLEDSFGEKVLP